MWKMCVRCEPALFHKLTATPAMGSTIAALGAGERYLTPSQNMSRASERSRRAVERELKTVTKERGPIAISTTAEVRPRRNNRSSAHRSGHVSTKSSADGGVRAQGGKHVKMADVRKLQSFERAMRRHAEDGKKPHLLLGNGF